MKARFGAAGAMAAAAMALAAVLSPMAHADAGDPIQTFRHGASGLCLGSPADRLQQSAPQDTLDEHRDGGFQGGGGQAEFEGGGLGAVLPEVFLVRDCTVSLDRPS